MDSSPAPERPDPVTPDPARGPGDGSTRPDGPRADAGRKPPPVRNITDAAPARREMPPDLLPDEDAPLPPSAWLARNGVYLLAAAALVVFLYYRFGLEGMWSICLVAVGLGLVVFVHELGHFAVAKWCDVYVQTFSIGFGPALPGCRFKWGETVYKISLLPLGGYVQMLGEGTETEGDEDNPRSFKNKRVGQRMLIISAGVIMNVLLACVCFIAVFWGPGQDQQSAVVGATDPGNRAWEKGIPSGALLTRIGGYSARPGRPLYFADLMNVIVGSSWGEKVPVRYDVFAPGSDQPQAFDLEIEPRKDSHDDRPVIGVVPADSVELVPTEWHKDRPYPYHDHSAAAAARRAFPLHPGEFVVATTDPNHPGGDLAPLTPPADENDQARYTRDLAERCAALAHQPMKVRLGRQGTKQTRDLDTEPSGFRFGDKIVATSDPDHPDEVTDLPHDPRNPRGKLGDYFTYLRRLQRLAGRFMTIRVRHPNQEVEDLWVPPAYHLTLGARMRMGQVAGVRDDSPAARAGVRRDDYLKEVLLKDGEGHQQRFAIGEEKSGERVDPVRLPEELRRWADARRDVKAVFTVVRNNPRAERERVTEQLPAEVPWDDSWRFDEELPGSRYSPMAVPELGLAYRVGAVVEEVSSGPLQKNDIIKGVRLKHLDGHGQLVDWDWDNLDTDGWAWGSFLLQKRVRLGRDDTQVALRVERGGKVLDDPVVLELVPAYDWPMAERGLMYLPDIRLEKADNPAQALYMGFEETGNTISNTYRQLRGFVTGRISPTNAGGPIKIGAIAYSAASAGVWKLVFFLGIISINLAVINFLPIPFLDGGHMVFLLYEKIRGRPAREAVMAVATYVGLLFLLAVMVFFFFYDIKSLFFKS